MNGDGVSTCAHCGRRVVLARAASGDVWLHQNTGMVNCETTVATPVLTETPEVLTGQVAVSGNEEED